MSDLISRQDVLGAMIEQAHISGRYKLGEVWELNLDEIKEAVNRIPSAEKVDESDRLMEIDVIHSLEDIIETFNGDVDYLDWIMACRYALDIIKGRSE